MSKDNPLPEQTNLFGDGLCVVCGQDVEPTISKGQLVTLLWCSSACTEAYASRWLTNKQAVFFKEYLIDLNATQAAIRSGYSVRSANQIAAENMAKPVMQQAISLAMAERSSHLKITAAKVMADIELVRLDSIRMTGENQTMNNPTAALRASELQGRHKQMFVDKTEVVITDNLSDRLQRAREREKQRD